MIVSSRLFDPVETVNYVDYIESTGTQWIDTGYLLMSEKVQIKTKLSILSYPTTAAVSPFGAETATTYVPMIYYYSPAGNTYVNIGGNASIVVGSIPAAGSDVTYELTADNGGFTISTNGTIHSNTYSGSLDKTMRMYIFADNGNGTAFAHATMKLYYFQLYDNGTIVRDFRPCLDPEGEACLYDKVTKMYFRNSGTGSFTAG